MRRIKEILRMRLGKGQTVREVARSVGVSVSTVSEMETRAGTAGVGWPACEQMDEGELETKLYPAAREASRPLPDFKYVHTERRRKGVTLQLLWEEYRAEHPEGYSYSQYCEHYKRFAGKLDVVMRQTHRGGEKMFVERIGNIKALLRHPESTPFTEYSTPGHVILQSKRRSHEHSRLDSG